MSNVSGSVPKQTSARKVEANRRNAKRSTGPRSARGKSWSRLNALKHGILASQAVITMTEGRDAREAFEELVDGLALDFAPVGTFEHTLVQQIAACFWRQRRLLMFENRAAFESRDRRTYREMNQGARGPRPLYILGELKLEGDEVLDRAEVGLDLPGEADTLRLIRYEASITRSLKTALAQLNAHQRGRLAAGRKTEPTPRPSPKVVVDQRASKRAREQALYRGAKSSLFTHGMMQEQEEEEAQREAEQEAAAERAARGEAPADAENDQTKPNSPEDADALARHLRLMQVSDAVLKLSDRLAPKAFPTGD